MTLSIVIWSVLPMKGVFLSESTCDGRVELKRRGDATAAAMAITTTEKLTSAMVHGRSWGSAHCSRDSSARALS